MGKSTINGYFPLLCLNIWKSQGSSCPALPSPAQRQAEALLLAAGPWMGSSALPDACARGSAGQCRRPHQPPGHQGGKTTGQRCEKCDLQIITRKSVCRLILIDEKISQGQENHSSSLVWLHFQQRFALRSQLGRFRAIPVPCLPEAPSSPLCPRLWAFPAAVVLRGAVESSGRPTQDLQRQRSACFDMFRCVSMLGDATTVCQLCAGGWHQKYLKLEKLTYYIKGLKTREITNFDGTAKNSWTNRHRFYKAYLHYQHPKLAIRNDVKKY